MATDATPRRGRPRSPERDAAILDAALKLLAERGYARMSMDGIAAEAGVGKPTIYSRYRSKADLATAALRHLREAGAPEPTGDLRRDLVAQLRQLRVNTQTLGMSLLGTCLSEEPRTPGLLDLFRERLVTPRREILREILVGARNRGDVAADADIDAAVTLLAGALHGRYLGGAPLDDGWEDRVVDTALRGLLP